MSSPVEARTPAHQPASAGCATLLRNFGTSSDGTLICRNILPGRVSCNISTFWHFGWVGISRPIRTLTLHHGRVASQGDEGNEFQQRCLCSFCVVVMQGHHRFHKEIACGLYSTVLLVALVKDSADHDQSALLLGSFGGREHEVHVGVGRAVRRQRVLARIVRKEVFDAVGDNRHPFFVDGALCGRVGGRDKGQHR